MRYNALLYHYMQEIALKNDNTAELREQQNGLLK